MKIKSILAEAAKCKTKDDADKLRDTVIRVFGNSRPFARFQLRNHEARMVDGTVYVRFEIHQQISAYYVTTIIPEILEGKLTVEVETHHMRDGRGICCDTWKEDEGMIDIIKADDDITMADLAQSAKVFAIANYAQLFERVGMSKSAALAAAKKSW